MTVMDASLLRERRPSTRRLSRVVVHAVAAPLFAFVASPLRPTPLAAQVGRPPAAAPSRPQTTAVGGLTLEASVTTLYDSNIEHEAGGISSYGFIGGASATYRFRSTSPRAQLFYGVALHSYAHTDRWDRVSQAARAIFALPRGPLTLGLTAEALLKGSSEDRQVGNQFALLPSIELRPSASTRLRTVGAYRRRYYEDTPDLDAENYYVDVDGRAELGDAQLEAGARFERNNPELLRNRFERETYNVRLTMAATARDEILFDLKNTRVLYPERLVELDDKEDNEAPRRDRKWTPRVSWLRDWGGGLQTELEYELETRDSNDPDKDYRGNLLTLTTRLIW
jgi:hypothetical protein